MLFGCAIVMWSYVTVCRGVHSALCYIVLYDNSACCTYNAIHYRIVWYIVLNMFVLKCNYILCCAAPYGNVLYYSIPYRMTLYSCIM